MPLPSRNMLRLDDSDGQDTCPMLLCCRQPVRPDAVKELVAEAVIFITSRKDH
jgi:hypothetical protein